MITRKLSIPSDFESRGIFGNCGARSSCTCEPGPAALSPHESEATTPARPANKGTMRRRDTNPQVRSCTRKASAPSALRA